MGMDYGISQEADNAASNTLPKTRTPSAPVYQGGSTYIPSMGMSIGPDLGGAVAGDQARQEYMLNQNKDARAEEDLSLRKDYVDIAREDLGIRKEDLSMKKEKFSWDRSAHDKEEQIQKGMADAAQVGGYSGVVDYLKDVDPERAIQFHSNKIKLDDQILNNDVLQSTAQNDKSKAMFESYGILGKMGTALLNAPEDQRDAMFKTMDPMLEKVLGPNRPKTLAEAVPTFMLGIGQATPENMLFASNKSSVLNETDIGKNEMAQNELIKKGATTENSQVLRDLQAHRKALQDKDVQEGLQTFAAESQINEKNANAAEQVQKNTESFNKTLEKSSSDYSKALDSYVQVKGHIEALKKDPTNSYSQSVVSRMFVKSINTGAMSIADESLQDGATGIDGLNKKLQNMIGNEGFKVQLTTKEQAALDHAWEVSMKSKYDRQKSIEEQYLKSANQYSNVNKQALRIPSKQYEQITQNYTDSDTLGKYGFSKVPDQYKAQLADALRQAGNNPKKLEYIKAQAAKILGGGQ
jgi:hypothetical protein